MQVPGKAIGFVIVLGLIGLSSWLVTRKARRVMGKALGREIRDGEETSLKAWMSMPANELRSAAEEMQPGPSEQVLESMDRMSRRGSKPEDGLGSDHISIR